MTALLALAGLIILLLIILNWILSDCVKECEKEITRLNAALTYSEKDNKELKEYLKELISTHK